MKILKYNLSGQYIENITGYCVAGAEEKMIRQLLPDYYDEYWIEAFKRGGYFREEEAAIGLVEKVKATIFLDEEIEVVENN